MNTLGERVRAARVARGLTQQELAQGVATKGFICQVELNRAMPSLPKLRLLADRLGLAMSQLTGDRPPLELAYLRKSAELALRAAEPERALRIIDEALTLHPTANERADLFRIRGTAHDALGDLTRALAAHQTAAATAPADDPELNAAIYVEIGTVLQEQEQFNAAIEASLRAVDWLDRCKHAEPALRARVLTNLGRSSYALGQISAATDYLQRSLAAATDAESLIRIANAHMGLGVAARAAGDLDAAIEHCNRALELHKRLGQERFANRVLNNLGDALYASGRRDEARSHQIRCLSRAKELNDLLMVGFAGSELARYLLSEGKTDEASAFAREAELAAREVGDHLREGLALALQGVAAERHKQAEEADRYFRHALRLLSQRQAAGKLAEVCALYSDVLRDRGEVDRAFAFMRMAADRDFTRLPHLLKQRRK